MMSCSSSNQHATTTTPLSAPPDNRGSKLSASATGELPSDGDQPSDRDATAVDNDASDASDASDDADERDARRLLLADVAKRIARMLEARDRVRADHSDNNNMDDEGDAVERRGHSGDERRAHENNNGRTLPTASPRECFLRHQLAEALVELSSSQTNLRLAASAGKVLLAQLAEAQDDNARLWEQQRRLERELAAAQHAIGRAAAADPARDDCRQCPQRSDELAAALHETNSARRRCLELERVQGIQGRALEELQRQRDALQAASNQLRAADALVRQDVVRLGAEHAQLQGELQDALAARDSLRKRTRRLERERDQLAQRLDARDARVAVLESATRAAETRAQVLANRAARHQADNEQLLQALAASQEQLTFAVQERGGRRGDSNDDSNDDDSVAARQQHAKDMESLLDEAQRALTALKLENRALRRQLSARQRGDEPTGGEPHAALLRRTLSLTYADILAADDVTCTRATSREPLTAIKREPAAHTEPMEPQVCASAPSEVVAEAANAPSRSRLVVSTAHRRRRTYADSGGNDRLRVPDRPHPRRTTILGAVESSGDTPMDKAPLFLGLSVVVCATAAAGLLARR